MKLLFINPPTEASFSTWYPPLGIAFLSSWIKKQLPNWETKCCDAAIGQSPLKMVKEYQPDLVGFTCTTIGYPNVVKIAQKLRDFGVKAPFVLGGQHISALPHILHRTFDACVVGEGEKPLEEICLDVVDYGEVPQRMYESTLSGRVENLDEIPFPDYDMFDLKHYLQPQNHGVSFDGVGLPMVTSRGCLYKCIFCSSSRFFKDTRGNSAKYVADLMQLLKEKYGVEYLNVFDDLFQYDVQRLRDLADLVEERGLNLKLLIQAHAPTFTKETAHLLMRIGVVYNGFGMEAATDRMLRVLKCGVATVADNKRAIRVSHSFGMKCGSGFLTGVPGETQEDLDAIDKFIAEEGLDVYRKYILCPYPGTRFWDYAKKHGLVSDDMDFSKIYQTPNGKNVVLQGRR